MLLIYKRLLAVYFFLAIDAGLNTSCVIPLRNTGASFSLVRFDACFATNNVLYFKNLYIRWYSSYLSYLCF